MIPNAFGSRCLGYVSNFRPLKTKSKIKSHKDCKVARRLLKWSHGTGRGEIHYQAGSGLSEGTPSRTPLMVHLMIPSKSLAAKGTVGVVLD